MDRNTIVQYSLSALTFIGLSKQGSTQIIYSDPEPDLIKNIDDESLKIDIDFDGLIDFIFEDSSFFFFDSSGYISKHKRLLVHPQKTNLLYPDKFNSIICGGPQTTYVLDLESNYLIDEYRDWAGEESLLLADTFKFYNSGETYIGGGNGFWFDKENFFYLGVRFNANNYHYGWIRLKANMVDMSLTISDFAFNLESNSPIHAGDKGNEITELKANFLNDKIFVFLPVFMLDQNTTVEIYEISGRRLFSEVFIDQNQIVVNSETFATGVYLINAFNGNTSQSAKVFLYKK